MCGLENVHRIVNEKGKKETQKNVRKLSVSKLWVKRALLHILNFSSLSLAKVK